MLTASSAEHTDRIAGVPRRLAAYLLDCLLLFPGIVVLNALIYVFGLNPIISGALPITGVTVHLWVFCTASLPILLYFSFFFQRGETPGMRLLDLRVTTADETPLSTGQAVVRAAVLLIPFELNHVILFYAQPVSMNDLPGFLPATVIVYAVLALYLVVSLLNAKRQSVHDFVAGSIVVRGERGRSVHFDGIPFDATIWTVGFARRKW